MKKIKILATSVLTLIVASTLYVTSNLAYANDESNYFRFRDGDNTIVHLYDNRDSIYVGVENSEVITGHDSFEDEPDHEFLNLFVEYPKSTLTKHDGSPLYQQSFNNELKGNDLFSVKRNSNNYASTYLNNELISSWGPDQQYVAENGITINLEHNALLLKHDGSPLYNGLNNNELHAGDKVSIKRSSETFNYIEVYINDVKYPNFGPDAQYVATQGISLFVFEVDIDYRPAISGQEVFVTNVNNPANVNTFVSEIIAIDDIDGNISHKIVIENDSYTANKNTLGTYIVDLSVTDSAGNKSEFSFSVIVADVDAPVVSATTTINQSYNNRIYSEDIKNLMTITDNYYDVSELTIKVIQDTYSSKYNKIGTYIMKFRITDPSENKTEVTFTINVVDNTKPTITGITEVTKSYSLIMTVNEIIADVTANDDYDGTLTHKIKVESDNYTGNGNKPNKAGEFYTIVLSVTDASGNKATHEIKVKVVDDVNPNWYVTNGVTINLPNGMAVTRAQIIDFLAKAGKVNIVPNSVVTYSVDTYSENAGETGVYRLAFNVAQPNGSSYDYDFNVNVLNESFEDQEQTPPALTIVDHIKVFFTENWLYITVGGVVILMFLGAYNKMQDNKKRRRRR